MPHVIVKCYPGRSAADKHAMAQSVSAALHDTMGYDIKNVSVAVEEIEQADWMREVYERDILEHKERMVKLPGYGPLWG